MVRVVLAMSGGVDSSVAAWLLRSQGHDVVGLFMRHGDARYAACSAGTGARGTMPIEGGPGSRRQGCCGVRDADDARRVAEQLDIPFYAIDMRADFGPIMDYFADEYLAARTPNPCIVCNQRLKFGKLFEYAAAVGATHVATGHHARRGERSDGRPTLLRGLDPTKDQSYALFGIGRDRLQHILLPVGEYAKDEIRAMAARAGLRTADKEDSQEICFVAPGEHAAFVRARRGAGRRSGDVVTVDGRVVGTHEGIEQFTIGQRRGLGIAMGEPFFVVRIEADTHRVVLGRRSDLARTELTADRCNWLETPAGNPFEADVKIRYNARPATAVAERLPGGRLRVTFREPVHGVAPGQAVVCYRSDQVLGGGWIE
ncbi:MAG: tRNA 2-thiouridine(34) synthase MnmA [Planctomycetes bacterium]|nr:tRNA 2-thiouridine(34) synthase MnmA [Planctomycetota bacterium]